MVGLFKRKQVTEEGQDIFIGRPPRGLFGRPPRGRGLFEGPTRGKGLISAGPGRAVTIPGVKAVGGVAKEVGETFVTPVTGTAAKQIRLKLKKETERKIKGFLTPKKEEMSVEKIEKKVNGG